MAKSRAAVAALQSFKKEEPGALEALRKDGAVKIERVLSPDVASCLLGHVNETLKRELQRKTRQVKLQLRQSLIGILGGIPTCSRYSHAQIASFLLDQWNEQRLTANDALDTAVTEFMEVLENPDLDALVGLHLEKQRSQEGALTRETGASVDPEMFGPVHASSRRWDMRLDLTSEIVSQATQEVLQWVAPLIRNSHAGPAPVLAELSSIISDPGNERQPLHSDTQVNLVAAGHEKHLLTVFVALQPIVANMGPTIIFPGSHRRHVSSTLASPVSVDSASNFASGFDGSGSSSGSNSAAFDSCSQSGSAPGIPKASNGGQPKLVFNPGHDNGIFCVDKAPGDTPGISCTCAVGDAVIMDSRVLHYGSANTSCSRRVLFYMSFHDSGLDRPMAFGSTLSLFSNYKGQFPLGAEGPVPNWSVTPDSSAQPQHQTQTKIGTTPGVVGPPSKNARSLS